MNRRLYASERKTAELFVGVTMFLFLGKAVERAVAGDGRSMLVFGALAGLLAVLRLVRGPLVGPALVEMTEEEVIFRQPFYIPTKTQRFRLHPIRVVKVVGSTLGRHFRLEFDDGSEEEVRPYFGPFLGPRAVDFLRTHLPDHVRMIEKEPPTLLSQVRGGF